MDWTQFSNITHPSVKLLGKCSLAHPHTREHTLTNNELADNVVVAICLFLLMILLKDIITRIVYMRSRFSTARDTITYFSQARIVLLDNSFFLRWVRQFRLFDAGHYTQRNHMQYNLVMLATLAMFFVNFGLIVPGLPANRPIYRDSDKIIRWESEYLDKGRIVILENYPCIMAPVLDEPNLKSQSSWSYCQSNNEIPARYSKFAEDQMILTVSHLDITEGYLRAKLFTNGTIFQSKYTVNIPLGDSTNAVVRLSDNRASLERNLLRNFDLLRNVTGITLTKYPTRISNYSNAFVVDSSKVKFLTANPVNSFHKKMLYVHFLVTAMIQGILTVRTNGTGSQLYQAGEPLNKTKIHVGAYIGTLVPAFFIVVFTAGAAFVYLAVFILFRSPPGGAWELLQAHERDHRDRILAGPPGDAISIK